MRKQIYFLITYFLFKVFTADAHYILNKPMLDHATTIAILGSFVLCWYWNKLLSKIEGSPKWHWGWLSLLNIYSVILHYAVIVSIKRKKVTI